MQATISLLSSSLSLIHIPRSRLPQLSQSVLRQILQPNPTFLNITCNEIELSLFAEDNALEDFEPIARRDRNKQRSRSSSESLHKSKIATEPVEISCEKWSVLQIDSHSDQIDNSGARVSEVSAPLAAAGISILYQSSYMSDFIFVKESRLREAMGLFATAGFDIYMSDPDASLSQTDSSFNGLPTSDWSSMHDFHPATKSTSGTILTRSGRKTDTSISPVASAVQKQALNELGGALDQILHSVQESPRNKHRPPTSGQVHMLPSDLTCVGLSDELGVDHWGLKIVKLVAFPDLICPPKIPRSLLPQSSYSFSSKVATPLFELNLPGWDPLVRDSPCSSSPSSDSDDDGYFSYSPPTQSYSSLKTQASRSYSDVTERSSISSHFKSPSKHHSLVSPIGINRRRAKGLSDTRAISAQSGKGSLVPFFSFTRTSEGSSLTADVYILAALFPPSERHMVIRSGELDAADDRIATGIDSSSVGEEMEGENFYSQEGALRCLQIDLREFGLDKHGLVNRFSQVLEENGINHLYSSTFKTANLLVDKKHAARAQALLRAC